MLPSLSAPWIRSLSGDLHILGICSDFDGALWLQGLASCVFAGQLLAMAEADQVSGHGQLRVLCSGEQSTSARHNQAYQ